MKPSATTSLPEQVTVEEFAVALRRAPWTVRKWAREGIIVSSKAGNLILIPSSEIERLTRPGACPKPGPKADAKPYGTIRRNTRK